MNDVKVTMRAVLMSEKDGVALNRLQSDYEKLAGPLDYRKLGYSTLKNLILDMPDTVRLVFSRKTGLEMCVAVSDASTAHLASLVSKQKSKKTRSSFGGSYRGSYKAPHPRTARRSLVLQPTYSAALLYRMRSSHNFTAPEKNYFTSSSTMRNAVKEPLRDQMNINRSSSNFPFVDKSMFVKPLPWNAVKSHLREQSNVDSTSNKPVICKFTVPKLPKRYEKCQIHSKPKPVSNNDIFLKNDTFLGKLSAPKSPDFKSAANESQFYASLATSTSQLIGKKPSTNAEVIVEVEMPTVFDWPGGESSLRGVLRCMIQQFPSGLKLDNLGDEFLRHTGQNLPEGVTSCLQEWQDVVRVEHGCFDMLFPTEDRSLQPKVPPVGFTGSVMANYVSESDALIYLMETARFDEYKKMTGDMQTYYNMGEGEFAQPLSYDEWQGGYCAVLYGSIWYRGRVVRQMASRPGDVETMLCVDFSEFGNMDFVAASNVYCLAPQFFTLPGSVFSFEFADFVVTDESLFVRTLMEEIVGKGLHVDLHVSEISRGNAMLRGQLFLDGVNFAERLVQIGCMEQECSLELLKCLSLEVTDDMSASSTSSTNTYEGALEEELEYEDCFLIDVISVNSLNTICAVRQDKRRNIANELHEKMKAAAAAKGNNSIRLASSHIEVGLDFAALVKEFWRRVRIKRVLSDVQIEVEELDLGDWRVISICDLAPLPVECLSSKIPYQKVDMRLNLLDENPSIRSQLNAISQHLCNEFSSLKASVVVPLPKKEPDSHDNSLPCVNLESLDGHVVNYDILSLSLNIRLLSQGDCVQVFVQQVKQNGHEDTCFAFVVQQRPLFRQLIKEMMIRFAEAGLSKSSLERLTSSPDVDEVLLARQAMHGWVRVRVLPSKDSNSLILCELIDFGIESSCSIFDLYRATKGSRLALEMREIPARGAWVTIRGGGTTEEGGSEFFGDHIMNVEDPSGKPFPLVILKSVKK